MGLRCNLFSFFNFQTEQEVDERVAKSGEKVSTLYLQVEA